MKKNLHEISTEELLKSIEKQDLNSIEYKFDNPILSFIQAFNLEPGKERVSDKLLLTLFKYWHKNSFFNQRSFNSKLELYLPSEIKKRRYFLVNKKFLDIAKKVEEIEKKNAKPKNRSKVSVKHFESFLEETGINSGTLYVEIDILYYIYNRWCDDNRKKIHFSERNFCDMCHLYFDHKQISKNAVTWFLVNNKVKECITKEEVQRWREGRKKNGRKKETENNNEVPYPKYQKQTLYFKKKENKTK